MLASVQMSTKDKCLYYAFQGIRINVFVLCEHKDLYRYIKTNKHKDASSVRANLLLLGKFIHCICKSAKESN